MPFFKFNAAAALGSFRREFRPVHGLLALKEGIKVNANFSLIIAEIEEDAAWNNIPEIAYALATAYHETGFDFEPKDETGKGQGQFYGRLIHINRTETRRYYGRGLVQLTWLANYARASLLCNLDFVARPERVKEWPHCYRIMADGMRRGWFTGCSLGDYITPTMCDFVNARRVINRLDRAAEIADYARKFDAILKETYEPIST